MRGCGCLVSLLMMGVGFVALAVFLIASSVPSWQDNADLNNLYASIFCGSDESVERQVYVSSDSDGTSYSMRMWCINNDLMRTEEVTDQAMFIGIGGFTILFTVGLIIGILSVNANASRRAMLYPNKAGGIVVNINDGRIDTSDPQGSDSPIQWGNRSQKSSMGSVSETSDLWEQARSSSPSEREDFSHKLRELQESYDQGLINRAEYDQLRRDILNRMSR